MTNSDQDPELKRESFRLTALVCVVAALILAGVHNAISVHYRESINSMHKKIDDLESELQDCKGKLTSNGDVLCDLLQSRKIELSTQVTIARKSFPSSFFLTKDGEDQ